MSVAVGYSLGAGLVVALDQAPVVLGSVIFEGHEVPSRIGVGGAQAVTIHRLPGGGRIIDAMGVDDGAIVWSGFFTGPAAASRARLVDAMRQGGQLVGLSFGDYAFNVVVVHFEYELQDRGALLSYRIRTEIVPDDLGQSDGSSNSILAALSNDIASAASAVAGFGLSGVQTSFVAVQSALTLPGDPASTARLAAVGAALQAGGVVLSASIAASGAALPVSSGGTSGPANALALSATAAAAAALAASVQAAGYVNRSNGWLAQLAGQSPGAPLILA